MLRNHRRHGEVVAFYYRHPERRMLPVVHIYPTFCPGNAMGEHGHITTLLLAYAIVGALLNVTEWNKDSLNSIEIKYGGLGSGDEALRSLAIHVSIKLCLYARVSAVTSWSVDKSESFTAELAHNIKHEHLPSLDASQMDEIARALCGQARTKVQDWIRKVRTDFEGSYKWRDEELSKLERQFGIR